MPITFPILTDKRLQKNKQNCTKRSVHDGKPLFWKHTRKTSCSLNILYKKMTFWLSNWIELAAFEDGVINNLSMHTYVMVTVEFNLIKSTLVIWFTKVICFFFW